MPLPRIILDDRSFAQLSDELRQRIPVYTPEWTDHNASDPGITLLELLAFLGENLLFRFNQIPEATRLEFLRLLQLPLRAPTPARALRALRTEVPPGVLVEQDSEARAGDIPFETRTEVRVLPVTCLPVAKAAQPLPSEAEHPEIFEHFRRVVDALDGIGDLEQAAPFASVTTLPIDFDLAVDGQMWIAVQAEIDAPRDEILSAFVEHEAAPFLLNLGFVPEPTAPLPAAIRPCPGPGQAQPAPAVEWQISTGRLANGRPVYRSLGVERDTTAGLTREGVVRLRLPRRVEDMGVFTLADPDLAGTRDLPPPLDETREEKVLFWLRAFRHDGSLIGRVLQVAANASEAEQSRRARPEFLGLGTGQPDQVVRLVHRRVLEGTLELEVEEAGTWRAWQAVEGFHASGAQDRHFVLDREAGEVRFGNGQGGWPPQVGQRIRARIYRYGGGAAGNVAAGAISKLTGQPEVKVTNPLPAHGGADAEAVPEALQRIPGELRRRDRAVTPGDFAELARLTPGARVGRADCLPRFHPHTRNPAAAGVVSVVVWPREDAAHPNAPVPDRRLLRSVCAYLDQRRLVTTEVYVIPPLYRQVAVAVGLRVKDGYGIDAVRRWVELVIRQYLAPLPPFGPNGAGWPLGRRVHGPELEAAALQVEGVDYLEGLEVAGFDAAAGRWVPGTVELALDQVVELTEITVADGPPLGVPAEIVPRPPVRTPVPIPVPRDEC